MSSAVLYIDVDLPHSLEVDVTSDDKVEADVQHVSGVSTETTLTHTLHLEASA